MVDRKFLSELAADYRLSPTQREVFIEKFSQVSFDSIKSDLDVAAQLNRSEKTVTNAMSAIYRKLGHTEKGPNKAIRLLRMIIEKQFLSQGHSKAEVKKQLFEARSQAGKDAVALGSLENSPLLLLDKSYQRRLKKTIDRDPSVAVEKRRLKDEIRRKYSSTTEKELLIRVSQAFPFKKKRLLFSESVSLPDKTVERFFNCDSISRDEFIKICAVLDQPWASVADTQYAEVLIKLVPEVKQAIYDDIEDRCGTLQILDVERPIGIDDLYVDVNILSEVTRYRKKSFSDLPAIYNAKTEETDRFALGSIGTPRVPGRDAVVNNEKMMIFGKPGAGKTTFLQHLAIQCNEDELFPNSIPVFIRLRNYVSETVNDPGTVGFSLRKYIHKYLINLGASSSESEKHDYFNEIVDYGCLFVLLDGLDEVPPEYADDVTQDIQELRKAFKKNRIVATCRIADHEHFFRGFIEVEISDFNTEQICDFSRKWFAYSIEDKRGSAAVSEEFIESITSPEYEQIRELAVTPILLVLACLVFQEREKFPQNRHELYKDGVDILLSKWDKVRKIGQRKGAKVYKSLSIEAKRALFSFVAASTFQETEYYFGREKLQQRLSQYFTQYFKERRQVKELGEEELDSIISTIGSQHGLIIARAANIFSFSHLTFQEYFTAEQVVKRRESELSRAVIEHITDKRYREIYLLAAEMLGVADTLLLERKQAADDLLAGDDKLQKFLLWLKTKALFDKSKHDPLALRAFYFDCYLHQIGWQKYSEDALSQTVSKSVSHALRGRSSRPSFINSDYSVVKALGLIPKNRLPYELTDDFHMALEKTLRRAKATSPAPDFQKALDKQLSALPATQEEFASWWADKGQREWLRSLLKYARNHRHLGNDWRFSSDQNKLLLKYYRANVGLINRLNTDAPMTEEVRAELMSSLLAPVENEEDGSRVISET